MTKKNSRNFYTFFLKNSHPTGTPRPFHVYFIVGEEFTASILNRSCRQTPVMSITKLCSVGGKFKISYLTLASHSISPKWNFIKPQRSENTFSPSNSYFVSVLCLKLLLSTAKALLCFMSRYSDE